MARKDKKKSKVGDYIYRTIMAILIFVMLFSGYKVYSIYKNYNVGTTVYDDVAEEVGATPIDLAHFDTRLDIDWAKLKAKNSDVKAWLRNMGTVINYPIVQGSDNDYYLERLIDGTWNDKGTLFVDFRCKDPFNDFLTIIYGHRMRDKSMFYTLGEYFEGRQNPYFSEHPTMELYTPGKNYDLQIFGAAEIESTDGTLYNFNIYDEEDKQAYIDWILNHNELAGYDNRFTVTPEDRIVMLSTCTLRGSANDSHRVVVWGKLTEVEGNLSGE